MQSNIIMHIPKSQTFDTHPAFTNPYVHTMVFFSILPLISLNTTDTQLTNGTICHLGPKNLVSPMNASPFFFGGIS